MYAAGWHIEGQSSRTKHYSLATGFFTNKGLTTVTWLKGGSGASELAPPPGADGASTSASAADDIPTQIRKLGELRDAGVLTEAEFAAKKAELLARM